MMRRRDVLTTVAAGSIALCGCMGDGSGQRKIGIDGVRLFNDDASGHWITLRIIRGEEDVVFEQRFRLPSTDLTRVDQPVSQPGEYTLEVAQDGEITREDLAEYASEKYSCVGATARITEGGSVAPIEVTQYTEC